MKRVSVAALGMAGIAPAAFAAIGTGAAPTVHGQAADTHTASKSVRLAPGHSQTVMTPDVSLGSHCTANIGVKATSRSGYQQFWYKNWPGTSEFDTCIGTVERHYNNSPCPCSYVRIRVWYGKTLEFSKKVESDTTANTTTIYGVHRWLYGQPLGVCTALWSPYNSSWRDAICANT
jgi:hypothetical protein